MLALTAAGAAWWRSSSPTAPLTPLPQTTGPRPITQTKPGPLPPPAPSFDIVRIAPDGLAVIAGRAAEAAEVIVRDGEREIGRTKADEHGQWVLTPDQPLPSGARELSLTARAPTGEVLASDASVLLVIPARPTNTLTAAGRLSTPLAVLIPRATAATTPATTPHVLQGPGAGAPAATSPNAAAAIAANHIVVQPGQTLWRIARHAYGEGMRYTVIFEANRDHITDPALIFPGQTFALPRAP